MDPEELKKRFEEKRSKIAASAAQAGVEAKAQESEQEQKVEAGRVAIRDMVLPYFKEIEAALPKDQFSFDSFAKDVSSAKVSFRIGKGPRYFIEVIRGNVRVFCEGPYFDPSKSDRKAPVKYAQFIFSATEEPFIEGPQDLTREKLGRLVQLAIDQD